MPAYQIQTPVVIFTHKEYGERLLFQLGESNPRNKLGKNGVSFHNPFSALFYKTIKIQADLIDEQGKHQNRTFYINRNSLIKYLGKEANSSDSDTQLVSQLNATLYNSALNEPNPQDKQKQSAAGEHLRHAGEHNQRRINHWSNALSDFIKGSFLSWLYQKTIAGIKRIKLRFLFVGSEKNILEAGEILAKKRFHEAYKEIPAYKNHITRFNGVPVSESTLRHIPLTSKENYIKFQQHDSDTHRHGKYPTYAKTDTSTGTTGKPTAWVRSEKEIDTVKKSLQLAAKIQFGNRKLHYINAFALGPWATGLTTYELMRSTGGVFATGADKEKILDELIRLKKYETHQLELGVRQLKGVHEQDQQIIASFLNASLNTLLKNRDLNLQGALNAELTKLDAASARIIKANKSKIFALAQQLNQEKSQIVIAGYPPFLKDLSAYIKEKGHNLADFSAIGVVGGQAISEAMRDLLVKEGFNAIYSSYGASDLDINLGVEAEDEILIRKSIEKNPGLARELYGANKGLPMVFHYDPMNYHVECLNDDEKDSLVFTCTRDDRSSARIRYNLGDKGRVFAASDVQALLAKYGIFHKPRTNLPLLFVWGRDSTVVFNGANLAFTELERAITDTDTEGTILKKAFYTYQDLDSGVEKLEIWLELDEGVELAEHGEDYAQNLMARLAVLNQDFRYQLDSLEDGTALPVIRFFKRHMSPISEAGGHRKQVLVFQKENLPEGYQLPGEENCKAVRIPMSRELLDSATLNLQ
ncbi:hypothetical protein [Legionella jamestowniensis]|uniref:Uncharacterized protein n=1 Tax=Legionella jamestowniensis TaxID=455 RepID=A0A0W0UZF4_9GAMM|nr:hypothetical protein [Legionella jamestowniensis]KTD13252.1 hypothetical protein Ljam_0042 [Legionella jamestowniensis]SFL78063.1 hypothetical protein SAMN02746073_1886 [Legionella jamestowniensis DSM 19215]